MNIWYQMWGKTYQCQISNAGWWFIGVRFSKFHDFSMTFDDFSKFRDFPWLFQKILFFQVFQTLWEPCKGIIFKLIIQNNSLGTCCDIASRRMPLKLINEKSTLVQVMAWCHQATSHYQSQCWLRSVFPYGITRPQWVNPLTYLKFWNNSWCLVDYFESCHLVNSLRLSDAYMRQ